MSSVSIRAAMVIAAVYGYFLIFAQFAFIELLRGDFSGHPDRWFFSQGFAEKLVLGWMAVAGIGAGFWVAWKSASAGKIRGGLLLAGLAAAIAPSMSGLVGYAVIGILTGAAIGISTVSLATLIKSWCGIAWVGLGTGLAYGCCNLPMVFLQSPEHQAWIAAGFAGFGAVVVPSRGNFSAELRKRTLPFWGVLIVFTALVWLDSAAFFIIQHSQNLKAGTWGEPLLWRNGAVHLVSAVLAGFWLDRAGTRFILGFAWVLLAVAGLAVNEAAGRPFGGWIYPVAVSIYSTALVAWPAWFSGAESERAITWRAAWLFAIAGWFGSANGIGMAQSLFNVPQAFVIISGLAVGAVMMFSYRKYWRFFVPVAGVILAGFFTIQETPSRPSTPFERGKQVYLSEGCIHCHSQYVRPGTADESYWGPVREMASTLSSRPVLIGNRRQGPDLSQVGARRSATWIKLHFLSPQSFSPGTTMPSFAYLFETEKGADLVTYLKESGEPQIGRVMNVISTWSPSPTGPSEDGAALFSQQCAVCHGEEGRGNGPMSHLLGKAPANLVEGPFIWSADSPDRDLKMARLIKFGIPGTDMPGHETLTDDQIDALQKHLLQLRK